MFPNRAPLRRSFHFSSRSTPSRDEPLTARLADCSAASGLGAALRAWSTLLSLTLTRMDSTARIRELNDAFRTRFFGEGRLFVTSGIAAMPLPQQAEIMHRVHTFADFTPDNDPHGEHDFGSFDYAGKTIFWKIDCYDRDLNNGSPDPADSAVTTRVLTVLLAEEY